MTPTSVPYPGNVQERLKPWDIDLNQHEITNVNDPAYEEQLKTMRRPVSRKIRTAPCGIKRLQVQFIDSLRKYKESQCSPRYDSSRVNFIQRNKESLREQFQQCCKLSTENTFKVPAGTHTFETRRWVQQEKKEPLNVSLVTCYNHFSQKTSNALQCTKKRSKSNFNQSIVGQKDVLFAFDQSFFRMLKLKDCIRRKKLKSATEAKSMAKKPLCLQVDEIQKNDLRPAKILPVQLRLRSKDLKANPQNRSNPQTRSVCNPSVFDRYLKEKIDQIEEHLQVNQLRIRGEKIVHEKDAQAGQ